MLWYRSMLFQERVAGSQLTHHLIKSKTSKYRNTFRSSTTSKLIKVNMKTLDSFEIIIKFNS